MNPPTNGKVEINDQLHIFKVDKGVKTLSHANFRVWLLTTLFASYEMIKLLRAESSIHSANIIKMYEKAGSKTYFPVSLLNSQYVTCLI